MGPEILEEFLSVVLLSVDIRRFFVGCSLLTSSIVLTVGGEVVVESIPLRRSNIVAPFSSNWAKIADA